MEWLYGFGAFLAGVLLRLGVPLGFTLLLVWLLKRLDERWQKEAERSRSGIQARNPGCWEIKRCPQERRAQCEAYAHPEIPCWQFYRLRNRGLLLDRCLTCEVFRGAPLPMSA